jgi:5-formyltetrahydrofolate cyclo-ligase
VAVVPGLAFDAAGRRIGHGGGHYDRLLASLRTGAAERGPGGAERRLEHPPAVGLAFDFQVFDELPSSPDDVAVDVVVTESRTIRCTQQR